MPQDKTGSTTQDLLSGSVSKNSKQQKDNLISRFSGHAHSIIQDSLFNDHGKLELKNGTQSFSNTDLPTTRITSEKLYGRLPDFDVAFREGDYAVGKIVEENENSFVLVRCIDTSKKELAPARSDLDPYAYALVGPHVSPSASRLLNESQQRRSFSRLASIITYKYQNATPRNIKTKVRIALSPGFVIPQEQVDCFLEKKDNALLKNALKKFHAIKTSMPGIEIETITSNLVSILDGYEPGIQALIYDSIVNTEHTLERYNDINMQRSALFLVAMDPDSNAKLTEYAHNFLLDFAAKHASKKHFHKVVKMGAPQYELRAINSPILMMVHNKKDEQVIKQPVRILAFKALKAPKHSLESFATVAKHINDTPDDLNTSKQLTPAEIIKL